MADKIHQTLSTMWEHGVFEPQIHYIRFPRFRNLNDGLKIDFTHPITAIVGANGTNKTSILRALQGCPDYENIGKYWFGTALDIIRPEERHRFIYGRISPSDGRTVEVLKTRIRRPATGASSGRSSGVDPDYFEPSRPLIGDGMVPMPDAPDPMPPDRTATRWKAIEKPVIYIDFRAEISAFDKCFHHHDYRARRSEKSHRRDPVGVAKDLIRSRSPRVRRILDDRLSSYRPGGGREWVVAASKELEPHELEAVSKILGRKYSQIDVLSHRAFDVTGTTARLRTTDFSYSEAWAGSGEFAVIQLVTTVLKAGEKSLVLLDEPEVSLHPGAQRRLLAFLADAAKRLKLQVVFATHSPILIEDLPQNAIKVLDIDPISHRVILRQTSSPETAFVVLGHKFRKKTIVVEDMLAREIVLKALRGGDGSLMSTVDVTYLPGGASTLRARFLPAWALENRTDTLLMLDGDTRLQPPTPESHSIPRDQLDTEVKRVLGVANLDRYIPADTGGATDGQLSKVLDWAARFLKFLPGSSPEEWLSSTDGSDAEDQKIWWAHQARSALGKMDSEEVSSTEILEHQKHVLAKISDEHPDLVKLRADISSTLGSL